MGGVHRAGDPHVEPIHDFGEVDGCLFIDVRLIEGTDPAALVAERRRLEPARAVHLVAVHEPASRPCSGGSPST